MDKMNQKLARYLHIQLRKVDAKNKTAVNGRFTIQKKEAVGVGGGVYWVVNDTATPDALPWQCETLDDVRGDIEGILEDEEQD